MLKHDTVHAVHTLLCVSSSSVYKSHDTCDLPQCTFDMYRIPHKYTHMHRIPPHTLPHTVTPVRGSPSALRSTPAADRAKGTLLLSVFCEFWLSDGDEPLPHGVAGAGAAAADRAVQLSSLRCVCGVGMVPLCAAYQMWVERTFVNTCPLVYTSVCGLLYMAMCMYYCVSYHTISYHPFVTTIHPSPPPSHRSVGYEPPRAEHLDAILVMLRHLTITTTATATPTPAQRQLSWVPTTPVVLAVNPTRRSPPLPRLGAAGQPAYQHVLQRVYRMLRRACCLWPTDDMPVTPLVGVWMTVAAPWRVPKVCVFVCY